MSERKTLAGAYAKIETHEAVCAQRYDGITFKLNMLFAALGVAITMLLGGGAWALQTIIENQQQQMAELRQAASALPR